VQNCLAELSSTWDEWFDQTGPVGYAASYQRLFGNPFAYTVDPLVPPELTQPEMQLPWEVGETWYLTGGPHGGWAEGSGRPALDFVADAEYLGCTPSRHWVTAAADGRVVRSAEGQVILDLDGDGYEQSGWVLQYLHIHTDGRVETGAFLQQGERIGHPSCEGGFSEATHLHIARRYNGEWIPAGTGSTPMVLSGWTAHDGGSPYDGTMTRGSEVRTACECWEESINGLVSQNAP
jgi:LasA protease